MVPEAEVCCGTSGASGKRDNGVLVDNSFPVISSASRFRKRRSSSLTSLCGWVEVLLEIKWMRRRAAAGRGQRWPGKSPW